MKKYLIKTYGCQMNVHESEKIAGMLSDLGYSETKSIDDTDIIVYNTCCIRETAETRILGNIGRIKTLKASKPNLIIAVCGCMTQKDGTAEFLKKRCPFVDIIIGSHNVHLLKSYIESHTQNQKKILDIWQHEEDIVEDTPVLRTSGNNAWVNIMYGCDNYCSYCIVPYVRGRERSRTVANIIADVTELVASRYQEITLLGQNVNSYSGTCMDNGNEIVVGFDYLLQKVANISGNFVVKFMTSHPKDISEELIKVILANSKIKKSIHLPVQAGSNRILELMNRKYTREEYISKIQLIRKFIPNCTISTDIIVGFPSETDEEFQQTLSLISQVQFNNLYPYMFSKRSGTKAEHFDNQIPLLTKKSRIMELIDLQNTIEKNI